MTSQTSNSCYFLSPLYHAYFQLIALAVCEVVLWLVFLDTQTWSEGSYERESVLPSVRPPCPSCLPVSFLRNGSFVFPKP